MSLRITWAALFRLPAILLALAMLLPTNGRAQIPVLDESTESRSLTPSDGPKTDKPIPLPPNAPNPPTSLERQFISNLLNDQVAIWTSPFHLKRSDAWVVGSLAVATGGLIASDQYTAELISKEGSHSVSNNLSQIGSPYATFGTAAAFYLIGRHYGNMHARETGLILGEALIDDAIVSSVLKVATQRPRPFESDGHGRFFTGGYSFPSGHAIQAWTLATVISNEYGRDHPVVSYVMYGMATMVSVTRYTSRRHFLSDVFAGSAMGYGIGHYVYNKNHDASLDPGNNAPKHFHSEYMPTIAPQYDPQRHVYGVTLNWGQ